VTAGDADLVRGPGSGDGVDVVVVGAGISGLVAADAAHRAGRRVVVLEARDRVGGRLRSRSVAGGAVDLGATWFWGNEPCVWTLVERLGVGAFRQYVTGDAMFEPGSRRLAGAPGVGEAARFARGAQDLATRLAAQLPPDTIRLGTRVTSVEIDDDEVRVDSTGGPITAGHVVLALPPPLVAEGIRIEPALPGPLRELAARTQVWMGEMIKAVAVYPEPFWRAQGLSGFAMSHQGPFREIHDHSGPDGTPAALFGFAPSAAFAGIDEPGVAEAFTAQLTRLFGHDAARPSWTEVVDWSRDPHTMPARPHPGRSTAGYGAAEFSEPVHGRVHWASTETAEGFAGHIEGGVLAGLRAAEAVVRAVPTGRA